MKVLVTGGSGLVGKAVESVTNSVFYDSNVYSWVFISSKDCDLTDRNSTFDLFEKEKPDYVIHLAANVGGLFKNMKYKVDMLEKNLQINMNVLAASHHIGVRKLVACLSTCIFPDDTTYPINELMLHQGPPHTSNDSYAYAKRMLEVGCRAYQEQYKDNFICVIPTNIYGPHDNYNLEDAHVIPALIHRCYLAKKEGNPFTVYGSGKPLRQFIFSQDLGQLIIWSLLEYNDKDPIVLSVDEEDQVPIGYVAQLIAKEFDYEEHMVFDDSYADGQFKKTACNRKLRTFIPNFKFTTITDGIKQSVKWFIDNYEVARK